MTTTFARDQQGAMTLWLLVWSILFIAFAGLGVDTSNAYRTRTMLQVTADTATHAAVATLIDGGSQAAAAQAAVEVAALNMSLEGVPDPVRIEDVEFGTWDSDAATFTIGVPASYTIGVNPAVRVTARRTRDTGNALLTNFLPIVGFNSFSVAASSIAAVAYPPCITNGIIAYDTVSLTSNVDFGDYMCVHGQKLVSTRNNLTFGEGSVVSTIDIRSVGEGGNLDVPTSNFAYVQAHATPGSMLPLAARPDNVLERIEAIRTEIRGYAGSTLVTVTDPESGAVSQVIETITDAATQTPIYEYVSDLKTFDFDARYVDGARYFELYCDPTKDNANTRYEFGNETTRYENIVIVSTCSLFSAGAVFMKDALIAVDRPSDITAISLNGKTDLASSATDCTLAGNFAALTNGGMKFTADQSYANTALLASRDIQYTAGGDTNFNISIQSWTNVSMTANGAFGNCPSENPYTLGFEPFPRLVGG